MWGNVRYRSPESVIKEIKYQHSTCGVEEIRFHDDTFGMHEQQTLDILEGVKKLGLNLRIYAHSRVDIMSDSILRLFKDAGGVSLYYGIESGSEMIRGLMGKRCTNKEIIEVCNATKKMGIGLGVFLMFGYPGETKEDVYDTYKLCEEVEPDDVYCAVTKIQPGTGLYQYAIDNGLITDDIWLRDRQEYYTFARDKELDIAKGLQILFYERFSRQPLRSAFEKNNDLDDVLDDPMKMGHLKELASRYLQ